MVFMLIKPAPSVTSEPSPGAGLLTEVAGPLQGHGREILAGKAAIAAGQGG